VIGPDGACLVISFVVIPRSSVLDIAPVSLNLNASPHVLPVPSCRERRQAVLSIWLRRSFDYRM
jgi:hypothetical protein